MNAKIDVYLDSSGKTFGYTIIDVDRGVTILTGDGYPNEQALLDDLIELRDALNSGLNDLVFINS